MRLALTFVSLLWLTHCGGDHYEGGGRRNELPEPSGAGTAGVLNIGPGDASSSQGGTGGVAGDSSQGGDSGVGTVPFGGSSGAGAQ